jgi:AcrR family transcriptional regulator
LTSSARALKLRAAVNERSFTTLTPGSGTRDAIFASAVRVFSEKGFHGASMRELAEGAGVSPGNIYNHFSGKSDILLWILREASATQMRATDEAIAAAGEGVRGRFVSAIRAFVRYYVEHLEVGFIANSELRYLDTAQRREIVAQRDQQQSTFEALIVEGVAAGAFKTPHPDEAAIAILTMCAGISVWYRPGGALDADAIADRYARYALALVEGV